MLKNRHPAKITPGIKGLHLFALCILLGLTACQPSPTVSTPTASSLITPTPFEDQPIADGPVLLRTGITLRKVIEVGANNIRLVRNPADGDVYLLDSEGGIYRISDISATASRDKVASLREINGTPTGIAFGPDGTL